MKPMHLLLIEPLVEALKRISERVVLSGRCVRGTDVPESDIDLFIVSSNRDRVLDTIAGFWFSREAAGLYYGRCPELY